MRKLLFVSACALTLGTAASASAEPWTHDGFQFRGGIGGGFLSASESPDNDSISGGAFTLELYVGGHVVPGVAIGGTVGFVVASDPTVSNGQTSVASTNTAISVGWLAPYVDWHINPHGGFHLMLMPELTRLSVAYNSPNGGTSSSVTPVGWGIGGGIGYDFWVARAFNIGILGRLNYANNSYAAGGVNVTDGTLTPTILVTFNYH